MIRSTCLVALGLVLPLGRWQSASDDPRCERRGIAGLGGFVSVSRIEFGDETNRLTATYLFPDRARWHFEAYGKQRSQHQFIYRSGDRVHRLVTGAGASSESDEAERDANLLQMELRRAILFGPESFEWVASPEGARTARVARHACSPGQVIGTLVASGDLERPSRIEARGPDGALREWFEVDSWQEIDGRRWPREMTLHQGEQALREIVEAVDTDAYFLDLYFVPPDLRARTGPAAATSSVRSIDLIAITYRLQPLEEELDWPAALDRARAWQAEAAAALREQGLALDPIPTFEVSPEGKPTRCVLRLARVARPPPEGWTTREDRPGLALRVENLEEVDPARLAALNAAVPKDARAGVPYVRIHGDGKVEIDLPLEAP